MPLKNIQTICVCGAGTMGSGIAQLSGQAGFKTIQFDVSEEMLEKSKAAIEKGLQKLLEKEKISELDKENMLQRITYTSHLADCKANLVIEAIVENKQVKTDLFKQLFVLNGADTVFATNTSSLSINELAADLPDATRFAGMHFFNPAPVMKLVEIIKGKSTHADVIHTLIDVAKQMKRQPVICNDAPGFIVNRVARHFYLEAMKLVEEGKMKPDEIDTLLEASGFKMGPFKLMDLIGLDINYAVSNIVWEALGKPERLTPSALQQQKVNNGELGRKVDKGFYSY